MEGKNEYVRIKRKATITKERKALLARSYKLDVG